MILSKEYENAWLEKSGKVTPIKDMTDQHLITVVLHVDNLVRSGWEYDKPKESIAHNAPDYLQYMPDYYRLYPAFYWNAITDLKKRGLY